jgi:hypothetical protein
MSKQWIYRNKNKPFSVTEILLPNGEIFLTSVHKTGAMIHHNPTGDRINYSGNHSLDLILYEPYKDYKIDDKVYCGDSVNSISTAGHFSKVNKYGQPTTFINGRTSFTEKETVFWNYCEKAKSKDKQ